MAATGVRDVGIDIRAKDMASSAIRNVGGSLQGLGSDIDKTSQKAGLMGKTMGFVGQGMQLAFGFSVMGKISQGIGFVKNSIIGYNSQIQNSTASMVALTKDAEGVGTMIKELTAIANNSPFELPGLLKSSQMLVGLKFNMKDIPGMMTAIGDTAAATGGANVMEKINSLTMGFVRMQAAGRVTGEVMEVMRNSGVPALDWLAKGFGVTSLEMQKMIAKGVVPADKAMKIMLDSMRTNYGGQAAAQAKTFTGAMSTIKDAGAGVIAQMFAPLFDVITKVVFALGTLIQTKGVTDFATRFAAGLTRVLDTGQRAVGFLVRMKALFDSGGLPSVVAALTGRFTILREEGLRKTADVFESVSMHLLVLANRFEPLRGILTPLGVAFADLSSYVLGFLRSGLPLGTTVTELSTVFGSLAVAGGRFREFWQYLATAAGPAITNLTSQISEFLRLNLPSQFGFLADAVDRIGGVLATVVPALMNFVSWLTGSTPGAETARKVLVGIGLAVATLLAFDKVSNMVTGFGKAVQNTLSPALKFVQHLRDIALNMAKIGPKTVSLAVRGAEKAATDVGKIVSGLNSLKSRAVDLTIKGTEKGLDISKTLIEGITKGGATGAAMSLGATIMTSLILPAMSWVATALASVALGPLLIGAAIVAVIGLALAFPEQAGYIAGAILGMLVNAVATVVSLIAGLFSPLVGALVENFTLLFSDLGAIVTDLLAGNFGAAFGGIAKLVLDIFIQMPLNILNALITGFGSILTWLGGLGEQFVSLIGDALGGLLPWVADWLGKFTGGFASGFEEWVGDAGQQALAFVGSIVDVLVNLPGKIWGFLVGNSDSVLNKVKTFGTNLLTAGTTLIGNFIGALLGPDGLTSLPGKVFGFLFSNDDSVLNKIKSLFGDFLRVGGDIAGSLVRGIGNGLVTGMEWVINSFIIDPLNNLIDAINSIAGNVGFTVGKLARIDLPSFDQGAFRINRDTLAVLHTGEMVVPARVANEWRGDTGEMPGARTVTLNVTFAPYYFGGSASDARAFARDLFPLIEDEDKRRGGKLLGAAG